MRVSYSRIKANESSMRTFTPWPLPEICAAATISVGTTSPARAGTMSKSLLFRMAVTAERVDRAGDSGKCLSHGGTTGDREAVQQNCCPTS
jgi:hypothetical protein